MTTNRKTALFATLTLALVGLVLAATVHAAPPPDPAAQGPAGQPAQAQPGAPPAPRPQGYPPGRPPAYPPGLGPGASQGATPGQPGGFPPPYPPGRHAPHHPPEGGINAQLPASHGHGPAAEHEHEGPPKDVNWVDFSNKEQPPYLAALINFAIVAFIYVYYGKKPIGEALKARRAEVAQQIDEAQKIKREAEARSQQYASKLEDLGKELDATKAALSAAGAGEKARIVREAEEKAARMEKDAQFMLDQERKQLRMDLQREAVAEALAAAEQLLKTRLTQADQERVAEEFLASLAAPKASATAGGAS